MSFFQGPIHSYSPDDWLMLELAGHTPKWPLTGRKDDADLDEWRDGLTADLRRALGLNSVEPVDRNLRVLDRYEDDGLTFERTLYDAAPGVTVTALLLLPHTRELPVPCVIFCPDRGQSKYATVLPRWTLPGDPERSLVRRLIDDNVAVFVMDPVGAGERSANEQAQAAAGAWLGRPLLGRWVADLLAGIDILLPRQELRSDRLAVAGLGAGGATALHSLALDKRLRVGVVGGQLAGYADRLRHLIATRWEGLDAELPAMCPDALRLGELWDVAGLCAPQPLMMLHSPEDRSCPLDAAREAARELRDAYARLGGKGLLRAEFLPEWGSRGIEAVRDFLRLHFEAQYV